MPDMAIPPRPFALPPLHQDIVDSLPTSTHTSPRSVAPKGRGQARGPVTGVYERSSSMSSEQSDIQSEASNISGQPHRRRRTRYGWNHGRTAVETIVIYPVNTANKHTSTDDRPKTVMSVPRGGVAEYEDVSLPPLSVSLLTGGANRVQVSANPLQTLYDKYKDSLPAMARARLLQSASADIPPTAISILSKTFSTVNKELVGLRGDIASIELELDKCRDLWASVTALHRVNSAMSLKDQSEMQNSVDALMK